VTFLVSTKFTLHVNAISPSETKMKFIFKDFKVAEGMAIEGRSFRAVSFVAMSILVQEMDSCRLWCSLPVVGCAVHCQL